MRPKKWIVRILWDAMVFLAIVGIAAVMRRTVVLLWPGSLTSIAQHREWMIRAFAIGLAVATIRPIVGLFFAFSRLTHLTPQQFFGTAFWLGFTLHLIAAEIWINYTRLRPQVVITNRSANFLQRHHNRAGEKLDGVRGRGLAR
jgi:hypothetical protein